LRLKRLPEDRSEGADRRRDLPVEAAEPRRRQPGRLRAQARQIDEDEEAEDEREEKVQHPAQEVSKEHAEARRHPREHAVEEVPEEPAGGAVDPGVAELGGLLLAEELLEELIDARLRPGRGIGARPFVANFVEDRFLARAPGGAVLEGADPIE